MYRGFQNRSEYLLSLLENGDTSEIEDLSDDENEALSPEEELLQANNLPTNIFDRVEDIIQHEDIQEQVDEEIVEEEAEQETNNNIDAVLTEKSKIKWTKEQSAFKPKTSRFIPADADDEGNGEILSPIHYFAKYIPNELFPKIAEFTNMYALQKDKQSFKSCSSQEIKVLFALHIAAGTLKLPRARMYWEKSLGLSLFTENMTRDRFFQLRNNIHFVNNLERRDDTDVFYKVRPLYDSIKNRCSQLKLDEDICIDEQMVPFTGSISVKQYVKSKPNPWGIKIFLLCSKNGLVHDFLIYQGSKTELDPNYSKKFGLGAAVVLKLTENILEPGHILYFDNYFSSYHLLQLLKEKDIFAACTVRINRFRNPDGFTSDKQLKKKERGYSEELYSEDGDIVIVKWIDNRPVTLASNFVGIGNKDTVRRYSKQDKKYIEIERPEIIKKYNQGMGGVDLMDRLISHYRIYIRSKKWTLRMIGHAIDLAATNSWLEYRSDCDKLAVPKNKRLDLLRFRMNLATELIKVNQIVTKKRGRPSNPDSRENSPIPRKKGGEVRPSEGIRYDNVAHLPQHDHKKEPTRCKMVGCKTGRSHYKCIKCDVHLCICRERNCFFDFHTKK